ncbi:MAG: helix-turn-helix transcriptional regulator [Bacilli bacterium]
MTKLEKLIKDKNLTNYRLAKETGIKKEIIEDYVKGRRDLKRASLGTVIKLAQSLEISINELIHYI